MWAQIAQAVGIATSSVADSSSKGDIANSQMLSSYAYNPQNNIKETNSTKLYVISGLAALVVIVLMIVLIKK